MKVRQATTSRKAGYAPDFYIIVSTTGAQVETTRAIEVNPDDYIETRLYGIRGSALHFSVSYAKRIRSVQEKVWGFIDTFEDLNAVSNKI